MVTCKVSAAEHRPRGTTQSTREDDPGAALSRPVYISNVTGAAPVSPNVLKTAMMDQEVDYYRIRDLERAGFVDRGGKGSHRNFVHPRVSKPVGISGNLGDDAKPYHQKAVRRAIAEANQ